MLPHKKQRRGVKTTSRLEHEGEGVDAELGSEDAALQREERLAAEEKEREKTNGNVPPGHKLKKKKAGENKSE